MMTKKDYERAAEIIQTMSGNDEHPFCFPSMKARDSAIEAFAAFFRDDNPRFDATRFRTACVAVK